MRPTKTLTAITLVVAIAVSCTPSTDSSNVAVDGASGAIGGNQPTKEGSTTTHRLRGGAVRISELNYHSPLDDPSKEFVELANVGDQTVDLQGWCLVGTGFCFEKSQRLEPGSFLTIRQSEIQGSLSNGGERISLKDSLGQILDTVEYDDKGDWPAEADGGGSSLQRVSFDVDGNNPAAWRASTPTPGSAPSKAVTAEPGDLFITEIHYHPSDNDPGKAFVEVFNRSNKSIDLKGWCLEGTGYCWDTPTPLPAGQTLAVVGVFDASGLSRQSDRIRVIDPAGRVHDTVNYRDSDQWPAIADGFGSSLHRRNIEQSGSLPGNWEAAAPSPGTAPNVSRAPLLPVFDNVRFNLAPDERTPIGVSATVDGVTSVSIAYVVGFGEEQLITAKVEADKVSGEIPPQPAGSLVRFRLIARAGTGPTGSWPRQGDGARYAGTVVDNPAAEKTALARLQLFLPDDVWEEALAATRLGGSEGFPAVMAFGGEVIDNITIRIKGNQARRNRKKKWKVMLPAGHYWDAKGSLRQPVDQFDLLPAATDKSFSRELLTSDMQQLSGGLWQQVFPLRLERNNQFFGLYMYGESPEGDWRDVYGFSDETYVWKGEWQSQLVSGELELSQRGFRKKYERLTMRWIDDNDQLLRDMIRTVHTLPDDKLLQWAYQHLDIPQVIEAIATMRIVQHAEWQHKNYFVMFDPADERWRLVPIDFDLTFGKFWQGACGPHCDNIRADAYLWYPNRNQLANVIIKLQPLRSMLDRRTRELAQVFLAEGRIESRLKELLAIMKPDSILDRGKWRVVGEPQTMAQAQQILIERFLQRKRSLYIGDRAVLPDPQPKDPRIDVVDVKKDVHGKVVSARLINRESIPIDVSNRTFDQAQAVVPAGVVLPAEGAITLVFDRTPVGSTAVTGLVVQVRRVE